MSVSGKNWGIGCNSIHFIDLFSFITGEKIVKIDSSSLKNEIVEAKRNGFIEFLGTMKIVGSGGSELILNDEDIYNQKIETLLRFGNEKIKIIDKDNFVEASTDTIMKKFKNEKLFPFQSEITNLYINKLSANLNPLLVDYNECMDYHIQIINSLNLHLSKILKKRINKCPIT